MIGTPPPPACLMTTCAETPSAKITNDRKQTKAVSFFMAEVQRGNRGGNRGLIVCLSENANGRAIDAAGKAFESDKHGSEVRAEPGSEAGRPQAPPADHTEAAAAYCAADRQTTRQTARHCSTRPPTESDAAFVKRVFVVANESSFLRAKKGGVPERPLRGCHVGGN